MLSEAQRVGEEDALTTRGLAIVHALDVATFSSPVVNVLEAEAAGALRTFRAPWATIATGWSRANAAAFGLSTSLLALGLRDRGL